MLQPAEAEIQYAAGGDDKVTAMPQFLRMPTGDAKSFTNGDKNANASWSCEGFEDRQLKDKYPICPEGKKTLRTLAFQDCWDGKNLDSANHRDHVAFSKDNGGKCPDGFQAIPQLKFTLKYDIPQENLVNADTPFAVDSFPEQLHKPITDHADTIIDTGEDLQNKIVDCINNGKGCS
ncbi:DUF1996 domain-containing protein [Streptomyces sp. HNM0575]|nr:DUF1996 domain-containing protein [Streptomyces sp. HNM0575]